MKEEPKLYKTKAGKSSGTSYKEVHKRALEVYKTIKRKTKRRPYVRSVYFKRQKIFFDYFWIHLSQKNRPERTRRLRYFEAGIELIIYSRNHPTSETNRNNSSEIFHRFVGLTSEKEQFFVQIKEDKMTGRKQLMSIFPKK